MRTIPATLSLLFLAVTAAHAQLCPEPITFRLVKDAALTHAELDANFTNLQSVCTSSLDEAAAFTWPAPAEGFFRSTVGGVVSIAPIAVADLPTGIPDANVSNALTLDVSSGAVVGGTASKCAEWNGSGVLSAAAAACGSGGGGGGSWTSVIKSADETIDFSATLQDDNHLFFTANASTGYVFRAVLKFTTTSGADFKFAVSGPASPTIVRIDPEWKAGGSSSYSASTTHTTFDTPLGVDGTGAHGEVRIDGIAVLGASGVIKLQWAQNNGGAGGPTTVRAGSYLEYATIPP